MVNNDLCYLCSHGSSKPFSISKIPFWHKCLEAQRKPIPQNSFHEQTASQEECVLKWKGPILCKEREKNLGNGSSIDWPGGQIGNGEWEGVLGGASKVQIGKSIYNLFASFIDQQLRVNGRCERPMQAPFMITSLFLLPKLSNTLRLHILFEGKV